MNTPRYWLELTVLFITYCLTAKLGLDLDAVSGFVTLVWPPTGIAFAILYLRGYRLWPALALGAMLVNWQAGGSLISVLGIATGNTLEAVLGVYLFTKWVGPASELSRVRDVLALIVAGAIISTLVAAIIGAGSLWLGGNIESANFVNTLKAWWIGDAISDLVIAPLIIILSRKSPHFKTASLSEGAILLGLVIVITVSVFSPFLGSIFHPVMEIGWLFVLLIWTTLRFGQKYNMLFALIVSTIAVFGTVHGHGPFESVSISEGLISLQMFIAAISISGLLFGALGREKERALAIRSDFVSIASHELRTPITAIDLQLQVIKSVLKRFSNDPEYEQISRAIHSTDRQINYLLKLMNSLLDASQIEAGKLRINSSSTNLSALIEKVSSEFFSSLREQQPFKLKLESDIWAMVDSNRMEQVLINLFMNAHKYGRGSEVEVTLKQAHEHVLIGVRDHGPGIPADKKEIIFDKFERAVEDSVQGMGLGLYISQQIVNAHHGKIWVESELGKGTQFLVELPFSRS